MAEGFRHTAGGGYTLNIIRHGHDDVVQDTGINITGGVVYPGEALQLTENANGNRAFEYHDGTDGNGVYVAVEADGRGMTAQPDRDEDAYADGEAIECVKIDPSAGLNVHLATGETVAIGDGIGPAAGTGKFVTGATQTVAEADEAKDLSGASNSELVATEVIQ